MAHVERLSDETRPPKHAAQSVGSSCLVRLTPSSVRCLPISHHVHEVEWLCAANRPAGHGAHAGELGAVLYEPGMHG